jgi:hypothetical protein
MSYAEKSYANAKEAHAAGLVWVNVSLNAGKKAPISGLKVVGALPPKLAKVMEHVMFGDMDDAADLLREFVGGP